MRREIGSDLNRVAVKGLIEIPQRHVFRTPQVKISVILGFQRPRCVYLVVSRRVHPVIACPGRSRPIFRTVPGERVIRCSARFPTAHTGNSPLAGFPTKRWTRVELSFLILKLARSRPLADVAFCREYLKYCLFEDVCCIVIFIS